MKLDNLPEITPDNYYSKEIGKNYWSASQIKSFLDCPARAVAEINGEWSEEPSTALMVGSYVDAYFEGTLVQFKIDHPEIFTKSGELKAEYRKADKMIERATSDDVFMEYMDGIKQEIHVGYLFGQPFRAKYDVINSDKKRIVDLKTTKDMNPLYRENEGRLTVPEYWRWDLQMAIYASLMDEDYDTYLAIVTKEDEPDLELIEIEQSDRLACMDYLAEKMPMFVAMKHGIVDPERCGHCAYCRATKKLKEPKPLELLKVEI